MQKVIQLGRVARERRNVSLKTPLLSLVVIADQQLLSDVESLKFYVQEELNVRDIVLTDDEERYGITLEARVDWPSLGKKLKKDVQVVRKALPNLTQAQLRQYQRNKQMAINGIELFENDLTLVRVIGKDSSKDGSNKDGPQWEPAFTEDVIVLLDVAHHPELADDGLAREVINRFQRLRKKAGLVPTDEVHMRYCLSLTPTVSELDQLWRLGKICLCLPFAGSLKKQGMKPRTILSFWKRNRPWGTWS
ncbi:hypothetical protein VTK56DRAFT_6779 [Thermocarpiscus australiensis]